MAFFTYIVASQRNGTLYIGSTDDLQRRIWEHREGHGSTFTSKYGCQILVWYEVCDSREAAVVLEYRLKEWKRAWKLRLIEERNPEWADLYETLNC
jgi:putative endonuclease